MSVRLPLFLSLLFTLLPVGAGEPCTPTPQRSTGSHYRPITAQRGDIGQGLQVSGRILAAPDCKPVPGARIAHWQADEAGHYTDRLRAWLDADGQGRYRFETEWPNLDPPHIHFIVTAEGYQTLETQWRGNGPRQEVIEFDMVLERK
jgi:protocatechuate 3,4-dioxygenase beta subunit